MNQIYGRDLDLNLLRVFVVVAEAGSVTAAASRLYVTQPAVSAALKRLEAAVGAPLFTRAGRGITLTARGKRLLASTRPHLEALVGAALSPAEFEPRTSDRTIRLGLSDASESWLLPPLLRALEWKAPRMRVIVIPVQFRTVGELLASGRVDLAVTVADELPAGIHREPLFAGGFSCLHDPRRTKLPRKLTLERYLAEDHVIVSYNADLRGVVEDALGITRRVRLSIPSFHGIGSVVEGSSLLATVPTIVARLAVAERPELRIATLPFEFGTTSIEMLSPTANDDDEAVRFVRWLVARIARKAAGAAKPSRR